MRAPLGIAIMATTLLMGACNPEYIKHDPRVGSQAYCLYRITVQSRSDAPLKVGDTICVWCKKITFGGNDCHDKVTFTTEGGKYQYDALATGDLLGCQNCPGEALDAGRVFEEK